MNDRFDLVVIGAGIHGVGVAQAAAVQGYRVLVLEKGAVASGTSSRSSKLIHGGLRYLETMQLSLVRECLIERALLLQNAPDLVSLKPFFIPVYHWTKRRPWKISTGLHLYSLLGGLKSELRHQRVPRAEWERLDGLLTRDLDAVFRYYDAQTDDRLLTRAVLSSAQEHGAILECPARVSSVQLGSDICEIHYYHGAPDNGSEQTCQAACVVNAAGPWINDVCKTVTPALPCQPVDLVQGSHIVLDREISSGIYYVESRTDRRAVFVIPWYGQTLVGTTEHVYQGNPDDVRPLPVEIDYLMQTYNQYFPQHSDPELVQSFAGLRVLPSSSERAFKRPRETTLVMDNGTPQRFLSIYGGKLTAYRATGEKVVDKLRSALGPARRPGDTRCIKLQAPQ